ncbi:MAG: hypothetical protein ACRCZF_19435 [Gemmataceae bacterium]
MASRPKAIPFALVTGVVLIAAGFFLWWIVRTPQQGVTPDNVAAIRTGMTYAEVEALMGCPSGTIVPGVSVEAVPESLVMAHAKAGTGHQWTGRRAAVFITLDENRRVQTIRPLAVTPIR